MNQTTAKTTIFIRKDSMERLTKKIFYRGIGRLRLGKIEKPNGMLVEEVYKF